MIIIMTMSMMIMVNMMAIMILKVLITNTRNMIGFATQFIIVTQVQQMKMFNAQFEKEISAEARKNRKMMETVRLFNADIDADALAADDFKDNFHITPIYRWKEK